MVERLAVAAGDAAAVAAQVRALVPAPASVAAAVAEIVESVREGGDRRCSRTSGASPAAASRPRCACPTASCALRSTRSTRTCAPGSSSRATNVGSVARAGLGEDRDVELPQGQRIRLRELPVERAAVYAPGGRRPYPSSVVMGVVTARAAGVREVVVAAPAHPVILAACALCGADEVYRMGGAQAIAALALGTETIRAGGRDRRTGQLLRPGGQAPALRARRHRRLRRAVGPAGARLHGRRPAPARARPARAGRARRRLARRRRLRRCGADRRRSGASWWSSAESARPSRRPESAGRGRGARRGARVRRCARARAPAARGEAAEALTPRVRRAGCVFVGAASATAFGDYVAGSNHTLPTVGAARFASGLNVGHFRRRMSEVHIGGAAAALAHAAIPVAEAEGFAVHAESMSARIRENR